LRAEVLHRSEEHVFARSVGAFLPDALVELRRRHTGLVSDERIEAMERVRNEVAAGARALGERWHVGTRGIVDGAPGAAELRLVISAAHDDHVAVLVGGLRPPTPPRRDSRRSALRALCLSHRPRDPSRHVCFAFAIAIARIVALAELFEVRRE